MKDPRMSVSVLKRSSHQKRWCLVCVILGLSALWGWAAPPQETPDISIFLTGQEQGSLKPCGCSGGQLGGLERRGAIWDGVNPENRLILSTGNMVRSDAEQDLIKYSIMLQAYQILGYNLLNLTDQDLRIGTLAGAVEMIEALGIQPMATQGLDFGLSPYYSRAFTLDQQAIQVNVIAVDSSQFEHLDALDTTGVTLFLLNDANQVLLDQVIGQADAQDCVVFPGGMDVPKLLKESEQGPMVVSVGQRGRYVCQLKITLNAETRKPVLAFSFVPVSEELAGNQELKSLYENYQRIVASSQLQESYSRVPLSHPDLTYEGSQSCRTCHAEEYSLWSESKHARAFATLVDVGSQRDPECTICHVIGMDYAVGYLTQADTPKLQNVGCEVCHGPGSEHNRSLGKIRTQAPKMTCLDCHTPEHSGEYAGHEEKYLKKIIHWKEPKPVRDVK